MRFQIFNHKGAFFLTLVCLAFLISACTPSDCASQEVFCVGLVTDTLGIDDNGVNQDAWAGLQNVKSYGIANQVDYIDSVDVRDYDKNIAYFAERHYDVIITSGIGLRKNTLRAAKQYADIIFVGINQPLEKGEAHPNIIPITFAEDQMGFFAGGMAARITKTNVVGAVCEDSSLDAMWRYCEGFRAGVKFTSTDVKALIAYRDNGDREKLFIDEEWGRNAAQGMIRRGADVIFAAGGITAQGALRAAVESQIKAIGAERNQSAALGESNTWVVTSVYGDAQFQVEKIIRGLTGENIAGQNRGDLKFIPLGPKLPESLTPEFTALLNDLWKQRIRTNVTTTKP